MVAIFLAAQAAVFSSINYAVQSFDELVRQHCNSKYRDVEFARWLMLYKLKLISESSPLPIEGGSRNCTIEKKGAKGLLFKKQRDGLRAGGITSLGLRVLLDFFPNRDV
jgi:hypothetical protein